MANYAKMRLAGGAKSILPELAGGMEHITARIIGEAEKRGDALAAETIDRAANGLATVFYNLYQTFGCDRLVYGGGVAKLGERLMGKAEERFYELIPMAKEYPHDHCARRAGRQRRHHRGGAADGLTGSSFLL